MHEYGVLCQVTGRLRSSRSARKLPCRQRHPRQQREDRVREIRSLQSVGSTLRPPPQNNSETPSRGGLEVVRVVGPGFEGSFAQAWCERHDRAASLVQRLRDRSLFICYFDWYSPGIQPLVTDIPEYAPTNIEEQIPQKKIWRLRSYLNATSREGPQVEFAYVKLPRNDPCTHGSTY